MDPRDLTAREETVAEFWTPAVPATSAAAGGLAVVVCTYARPESLVKCVASLRSQTRRPDTLLVVDASPDDRTERALRDEPGLGDVARTVGYLRVGAERRGLTRQRNVALGLVTDELVAFFDDDIVLSPRCLERMEAAHRSAKDAVGVGAVIEGMPARPDALWRIRRALGIVSSLTPGRYCRSGMSIPWSFLGPASGVVEGDWLPGGAVMWRTEDARAVRFNEDFAGYAQGEDLDFSLRVARRGRLLMACDARLEHRHEEAGRPDAYRIGYMAIANRWAIHRGLADRTAKDVLWFAYAWGLDSLLLLRHAVVPGRAGATVRQIAGRLRAAWDLVRAS